MELKFKDTIDMYAFEALLAQTLQLSRFKLNTEHKVTSRSATLKLKMVRLKESKLYCGNHPAECETRGFQQKPRKGNFLEGADWIGFNDMLNDIADTLAMSVDIKSASCIIRKGEKRRTDYSMHRENEQNQWDFDAPDEDFNKGGLPGLVHSSFPMGTPGEPTYLV